MGNQLQFRSVIHRWESLSPKSNHIYPANMDLGLCACSLSECRLLNTTTRSQFSPFNKYKTPSVLQRWWQMLEKLQQALRVWPCFAALIVTWFPSLIKASNARSHSSNTLVSPSWSDYWLSVNLNFFSINSITWVWSLLEGQSTVHINVSNCREYQIAGRLIKTQKSGL